MCADTPTKDEKYWRILDAVLRLEVLKGHLKWTLSDLSRTCKITRPLIYYYFGKEKKDILETAIKIIGEELFGLQTGKERFFATGDFKDSLFKAQELIKNSPHIPIFYLFWRMREGEIKERLLKMESLYIENLMREWRLTHEAAAAIAMIFWGGVCSPLSNEGSLIELVNFCKKSFAVK